MSFLGEFQKGKHAFFRSAGSLRTCRRGQRWIAGILMMMLFGSIVTVPVLAYGENSNKQEVVYINLNGDGSVDGIYVVNQFELNDTGRIIDYGDYTALRNLTTDDQIRFDNQTVKIDTTARKLYYQGTLSDGANELKDGADTLHDGVQALDNGAKELDDGLGTLKDGAKDLKAGAKSVAAGAAQLYSGLNVLKAENSDIQTLSTALYTAALAQYGPILSGYSVCAGSTTEGLQAMMEQRQAELTDDSAKASATQEAVTSRVNTLRSIVSGSDASYAAEEIAAAQDGLDYWNMTLTIQGEEAYREIQESSGQDAADVSAYKSAHEAYDSYASGYGDETVFLTAYQALADTVGETEQAAVTGLVSAALAQSVSDDPIYQALAVLSYYQGIINYTEGVASAASGASTISWGSESLYDGPSQLYDGVKALQGGSSDMLNVISSLMDGTAELREGTLELHDGVLTLRDGVVALKDGTQDLLDGITTLQDGTLTLCDGTITLRDGTVTLLDGAIELHDGSVKLHNGTMDLVNGTLELRDKTTDASLKEKLQKAIDDELGSNDFTPISFVSDRNTEVDFVQFVVKTPEISLPDGDYVEQVPKKLTVWQKFLSLFGFYQA